MNKKWSISKYLIPVILVLAIGIAGIFIYANYNASLLKRQAMIHQKGEQVMPFNLNQTTHVFKKTNDGGIQQVVAKKADDKQQISLIRMHLQMEAGLFQKGNFSDPTMLHGNEMPGIKELSNGASRIKITYSDLPNGGQITYVTDDTSLINAIHKWFDAQISDHGSDSMGM